MGERVVVQLLCYIVDFVLLIVLVYVMVMLGMPMIEIWVRVLVVSCMIFALLS